MTLAGDPADPQTWPPALRAALATLPATGAITIAISGGLDSVFLLHAVARWYYAFPGVSVRAIHVNHNLNDGAGRMEEACQKVCTELAIPLTSYSIDVPAQYASLENSARQARYRVFEDALEADHYLLMAHHRDDQAETVLFRLLRGSGIRGLAGMPAKRRLGAGTLLRPLLELSREQIAVWAQDWHLQWTEDPSNTEVQFDRNFLRHQLVPQIETRWPGVKKTLNSVAGHAAESDFLGTRLAAIQRNQIEDNEHRLNVEALRLISEIEQKNLLRCWLRDRDVQPPGAARLAQGLQDLLTADHDRAPVLTGENYTVRRFSGQLYCVPEQAGPPRHTVNWHGNQSLHWAGGQLHMLGGAAPTVLQVTCRRGGEHFRPRPGGPSRALKKWLQEQAVPPWERDRLPLVWHGNELVAIGNLWFSPQVPEGEPQRSWCIVWEPLCR